jgi:hypothetical protein
VTIVTEPMVARPGVTLMVDTSLTQRVRLDPDEYFSMTGSPEAAPDADQEEAACAIGATADG